MGKPICRLTASTTNEGQIVELWRESKPKYEVLTLYDVHDEERNHPKDRSKNQCCLFDSKLALLFFTQRGEPRDRRFYLHAAEVYLLVNRI